MSSTLCCNLSHIVFSTKNRKSLITTELAPRLYAYLGGIARKRKCSLIVAGGVEDHVHLLVDIHPSTAMADLVRDLKSNSSGWVHGTISVPEFAWQTGYAAFSVSKSNASAVAKYISNQAAHHRRRTFKEELIEFLERHEVPYDAKYMFA